MLTEKEMNTKVCSKCREVKTLDSFGKSKRDGYQSKCKACVKEYNVQYLPANPEKRKEYNAKYYAANSEKGRAKSVEYKKSHPDYQAEWRAANPEKNRSRTSNYRAAKLEATPKWLTKGNYKLMEAIDKEADRLTRETGVKYEVDHIIPLQPPKVIMFEGEMIPLICAFHCPQNLQILTKSENCSKGNRFTPYVESELS